jgi:hypothetical protein
MAELAAALQALDIADVSDRVSGFGGLDVYLDEVETAALVCNLDVRRRMPWRSVLGVVAVMAAVLAYVQMDNGDTHETPSAPARVVEQDNVRTIEQPPSEPPAGFAASPALPVVQPARREPTRVRQKPVRREKVRADASPARARQVEPQTDAPDVETRAATKKEDYAAVTPPTLY